MVKISSGGSKVSNAMSSVVRQDAIVESSLTRPRLMGVKRDLKRFNAWNDGLHKVISILSRLIEVRLGAPFWNILFSKVTGDGP